MIDVFDVILRYEALRQANLWRFVQIGAHDGATWDPIGRLVRGLGWRGVCVEPHPKTFVALQETYRDHPQVTLVRAAIAAESPMTMLHVFEQDDSLPYHASMLASLSHSEIARDDYAYGRKVIPIHVPSLTPTEFADLHCREPVGLLQIDAEGCDAWIINCLLAAGVRPTIVNYENPSHADNPSLAGLGYQSFHHGIDTVWYLQSTEHRRTPVPSGVPEIKAMQRELQ